MRANQTLTTFPRLAMVMSSVLFACADDMPSRSLTPNNAVIEVAYNKRTTNGHIAASNLNASVNSLERQLDLQPNRLDLRIELIDTLLLRTQFLGLYQDFDHALNLAEETHSLYPSSEQARLSLAKVLGALHRFDEAITINESLPKSTLTDSRIAGYNSAQGLEFDTNHALKLQLATSSPSFKTLTELAHAESNRGNFEEADQLYRKALTLYQDVSPFPVAWVMFQRGVMWAEQADEADKALPLYREAVARLPAYVVASVHLAELENEIGNQGRAIQLLSNVIDQTQDPEPAGLLAELLEQDRPNVAQSLAQQASATYDALLDKHRAAFADHGAEFFSGPGQDPRRALSLALFNLERRDTDRAYKVAIETALEATDLELACQLSDQALERKVNPALMSVIIELNDLCPTKD